MFQIKFPLILALNSVCFKNVLFSIEAALFPAVFLLVASFAECDRLVFMMMLMLTAGFGGTHFVGVRVNPLDLAPNYAGALLSYINGMATIVTFIFPIFTGIVISDVRISSITFLFL